MWDEFEEYVNQGVLKFIPRNNKDSKERPEWINSQILEAIKFKHIMWYKY